MEHVVPVERDEMYFLLGEARRSGSPPLVVPERGCTTRGDVTISLSRLADFLADAGRGGSAWSSTTATRPGRSCVEDDRVAGRRPRPTWAATATAARSRTTGPAEEIRARVTILADGTHGVISQQFRERFGGGTNPQVYSLGIKAVVQFPGDNPFGNNRVDPHPGLPDPGERLRRRLHLQHGREDRRGRPDPGPRLEVRRPQPAARVRALPRPPVHREAPRAARSRSPPAPRRSPRAATSPWAR